ncbi:MAG TPA: hypothetical protein VIY49_32970 [Bryobacteraceae bacterium]
MTSIRAAFDGESEWLRRCRAAAESIPGVRTDGPPEIIVTDSINGEGWHFTLNGRRLSRDLREFFWHANRGPHPIDLSLNSEEGVEGTLRIGPDPSFYWREQHARAMEAAPALLTVAILRRLGRIARPADPPSKILPPNRKPDAAARNWFRLKKLIRSLYLCIPGTNPTGRWNIALHPRAAGAIPRSGWKWTSGFPGHQAADPFLVSYENRLWLFYEDMLPKTGHGRLAVMPALEQGAEASVILEKPYHLSYPCVFEHGGDWWMVPESAGNKTVDLYRARRFPYEWEDAKTLIQGPQLKDTTPFLHEGRWYFFTTALLPGRALVSLLFTAEALDAPWRLHPASPLTGDASWARSAGPISQWKGRLVRPVQDCLVKYGYSIKLREILELSPTDLEERPMEEILPSWQPGIRATHTFCPAGGALALDARR